VCEANSRECQLRAPIDSINDLERLVSSVSATARGRE